MSCYIADRLPDKKLLRVEFTDPLYKFPDTRQKSGKEYMLQQDYEETYVYSEKEKYKVTALKGFLFDGFSTDFLLLPKMLQGKFTGAVCGALFHDLDFRSHFSRRKSNADWILLVTLECYGYCWPLRNAIYIGPVIGGHGAYKHTQQELIYYRRYVRIERIV